MNTSLLRFRLRKLRTLGPAEAAWLVRAQAALVWASVLVRVRPAGKLVSASAGAGSPQPRPSDELGRARRLAQAVERVANHGIFRPTCLVKSVALQRMLRSQGVRGSRIHIGVRLRDGDFVAHAWVDLHGTVLNDTEAHVEGFDPLCDVDLAGRS